MHSVCTSRSVQAILVCFLLAVAPVVQGCAALLRTGMLSCTSPPGASIFFPDYCVLCRYPRADSVCGKGLGCKETTRVWAETAKFAVISDIKTCGCPPDFVHGLVLPRTPVTGVEDPRKPDEIWSVAWEAARKRISDENAIALVVNPATVRTQASSMSIS